MNAREKRDMAVLDALATIEARGDDEDLIDVLRAERDRIVLKYNLSVADECKVIQWASKKLAKADEGRD